MNPKAVSDVIGYIAAGIGICVFMPQVYKSFKTKRTKDVSFPTFLMIVVVSVLWVIYGALISALPVIIVNSVILILSLIMLSLKRKYG